MATRGKSRPTMVDVAAAANTSVAVVSWVVNNGPRPVSEEKKRRVRLAIEQLGYLPDRAAQSLKRGTSRLLGLAIPDVTRPFFGALVKEIEHRARERNLLVLTSDSAFDAAVQETSVIAYADAGVDALIMVGLGRAPRFRNGNDVPIIWVHDRPADATGRLITSDHVRAGELAAEHLVSVHARSAIHFIGGPDEPGVVERRLSGAAASIMRHGEELTAHATPSFDAHHAYEAARAVLESDSPVDAFIVGTHGQTSAVIRACVDANVVVGAELSVVSFDGDSDNAYGNPVLTAVQQDVLQLAELAVAAAAGDQGIDDADVQLNVELFVGESCGCQLARPAIRRPREASSDAV